MANLKTNNTIGVTVITVCYNSEKTIAKTIESILGQATPPVQYIVVDGASSDDTVKIVNSYRESLVEKGIDFTLISQPDRGMYDAINHGLTLASGEIVGILNSDDFYEPYTVSSVTGEFVRGDFDVLLGAMRIVNGKNTSVKRARNSKYFTTLGWNHPSMFVRRSLYQKFQYRIDNHYADLDFFLSIRRTSKVKVADTILTNYVIGGMSTDKSFKKVMTDITIRNQVYKRNSYSSLHCIDNFCIELVKFLIVRFSRLWRP